MTEDEQFNFTFSPKINEASKVLAEQRRARERLAADRMETMIVEERQKKQQQEGQQEKSEQREEKDDNGSLQASGSCNLNTSPPQGATSAKPAGPTKTFQRYSFESELTFAPRLNATSMRLARERERQGSVAPSAPKQVSEEEYTFTFQPRVSSSSRRIAQNLGTTFMARQQMHLDRQRKLLEQGQLPSFKEPMQSRLKRLRHQKLPGEAKANLPSLPVNNSGEEGTQHDSSSDGGSDSGLTPRKRPTRGGEVSKSHPVPTFANKLGVSANGLHGSSRKKLPPKYLPGIPDLANPPSTAPASHQRSQTLPLTTATSSSPRRRVNTAKIYANVTRVKNAKLAAERAMRTKRVFTIQGPYPFVRKALRERGWVERFMKPELKKKERSSKEEDSDEDDDGDNGNSSDSDDDAVCDAACQDSTTEVENGDCDTDSVYGIMVGNQDLLVSRMLRNANPSFIWTCRANTFDGRMLRKDQIYNHYTKANFTTKVGLCMNLRQLPWYEDTDANWFYPRCYRLSVDEEKYDFIDDYRLTAAASILKVTLQQLSPECHTPSQTDEEDEEEDREEEEGDNVTSDVDTPRSTNSQKTNNTTCSPRGRKQKKGGIVPTQAVETSLTVLERFLSGLEHDDIEDGKEHFPPNLSEEAWNTFIQQYYTLVHDGGTLSADGDVDIDRCIDTLDQFKEAWPQCQIDGTTNMWIVKPGAKSRGREIKVMNKLEDICKLVESTVFKKEGKWVVQKYIEDPLLIHNTKFDIRQWFLVTDWNPLTIWFYKDCYLRFCSQEFSFDNFHEAIHLSNNSVQKHYSNSPRASNIPANLMWHCKTFKEYLRSDGNGHMWESLVYPGMKQAVIYAMEASQDMIESRKGSFELYGADFMLDTEMNPWLIEINSSPCMSPSTTITAELCASVLEDTMKVVLDRRSDKSCDTGRFELAFKQSTINVPPYIGISLSVEGQAIHKPVERRQSQANNGTSGNDSGNALRDSTNPPTNKPVTAGNSSQNGANKAGAGNASQQSNAPPKITYSTQNKDSNAIEPGKSNGPPLPQGYHKVKAKSALMQSTRRTVPAIRLYNNRSPNRQSMPLNRVEGQDFTNVEQDETAAGVTSDVPPQVTVGMGLTCVSCGGNGKSSTLPNKENLLFPVPREVPIMPLPLAMQGIDLQPKIVPKTNSVISINTLPIQTDSVRIGFHRDATGHHLHRRHHFNNPHHPHYHEGRGMAAKKKSNTVHRTVLNTGIVQPHVRPIAIMSQSYR